MKQLILNHISKSFARTDENNITHALSDINLNINDGEFVSIVGPSGCGKSTILRLIAGLIPPTSGEVLFDGKKIEGTDPNRGMVFQKHTLFPWLTVKQNAGFSAHLNKTFKDQEKK